MESVSGLLLGKAAVGSTAATAGLFGFGGSLTLGGVLSGVGLISALSTKQREYEYADVPFNYQAQDFEFQAQLLDIQSEQEEYEGKVESANIHSRMVRTVAAARATYAARGIRLGGGSAAALESDTITQSRIAEAGAKASASNKAFSTSMRARQAYTQGRASRAQGLAAKSSARAEQINVGREWLTQTAIRMGA